MIRKITILFFCIALIAGSHSGFTQPDREWKITTYGVRDGLRTVVNAMLQDSVGYIWLATFDGLIRYDGTHFVTYRNDAKDSLSLGANSITRLMLDKKGNVWVGFSTGAIARYEPGTNNFKNFQITDSRQRVMQEPVSMLYADQNNNIWVGITRNGVFKTNDGGKSFNHIDIVSDSSKMYDAEMIRIYNTAYGAVQDQKGHTWFATHDGLYRLDQSGQSLLPLRKAGFSPKGLRDDLFTSILLDKKGVLWFGSWAGGLSSFNPETNHWGNFRFQNRSTPTTNIITGITFCSDDCIWLTSADEGFGYFDTEKSEFSIFHREKKHLEDLLPAMQSFHVMQDKDNNVWVSHNKGLTKIEQRERLFYFENIPVAKSDNSEYYQVKKVWTDKRKRFELTATYYADGLQIKDLRSGKKFVQPIPMMATEEQLMLVEDFMEDSLGRIWVLTRDYLMLLDTITYRLKKHSIQPPLTERSNQYYSMLEDGEGNIWISSYLQGVFVLNPDSGIVHHFHSGAGSEKFLPFNSINTHLRDHTGKIWIASRRGGIRYFDPVQQKLFTVNLQRYGDHYSNKVRTILEDKQGYIWFGTEKGLFQTDPAAEYKVIASYTAREGIVGDVVYHSTVDEFGNIWAVTVSSIAMINPQRHQVTSFGEEDGYNNRDNVALGMELESRDKIIIPTTAGYFYFNPQQMSSREHRTQVQFAGFMVNDKPRYIGNSDTLTLVPGENFFSIDFTVIDFNDAGKLQFAHKLEGFNENWINSGNRSFVSYTNLSGGYYTFRVKSAISQIDESTPESTLTIHIIDPVYKRPWFLVTLALVMLGGFILLIRNRNKKIDEQREQIEAEKIISYFAASMNDKKTVDEVLWDVTRNCIGKMQFEDCVIYLLDEKENVLIQKASHGPKSDEHDRVVSPMRLPVGKGIVGAVAASGTAELISDTTKDPRYIVDDKRRYSEITVPIVSDGKVLGIIDCEHSKKHFFNGRHMMMLTTIASLCANKMIRVTAETERLTAQQKLMEVQQKMNDMEMQALRAQMNPHFIFNCLNSINRYIIKSDQATASLYLTRFAKLIRLILDNSNSKNVVLVNELEALKLYIEMEALRFEHKFTYSIDVEPQVNADSIEVPPLIIQPYVENAIWHGLLHKKEAGHLSIRVSIRNGNLLECVIEDNGVGREKAREMRSKTATTRKSLGMKLTESRLSLLNSHATMHASVQIEDLTEKMGAPSGTKVILTIPIEY